MIELLSITPEIDGWMFILFTVLACFTAAFGVVAGLGGGIVLIGFMAMVFPPVALIPVHGVVQAGSNVTRTIIAHKQKHRQSTRQRHAPRPSDSADVNQSMKEKRNRKAKGAARRGANRRRGRGMGRGPRAEARDEAGAAKGEAGATPHSARLLRAPRFSFDMIKRTVQTLQYLYRYYR